MYLPILISAIVIIIFIFLKSYDDQNAIADKLSEIRKAYEQLLNERMNDNSKEFVNMKHQSQMIYTTLNPISRTIETLKDKIETLERQRVARDTNLSNFIANLVNSQKEMCSVTSDLSKETNKMINLFKKPNIRGKWGEIQLQRLVELTGMVKYCEFNTQHNSIDGRNRPDMIIHLPNKGVIFVDAKAPIDAYLNLVDNEDNDRFVTDNLKSIKNHIYSLGNKEYWHIEKSSPNFVIMYIPVESIWLHAVDADPEIITYATEKNVIIATPMTLISLLKTIHYGWSQLLLSSQGAEFGNTLSSLKKKLKIMYNDINSTLKNYYSSIKTLQNCTETLQLFQEDIYKLQPLDSTVYEDNNLPNTTTSTDIAEHQEPDSQENN